MGTMIETTVAMAKTLFAQAERAAQQRNLSQAQLFALAVAEFIQREQQQALPASPTQENTAPPTTTQPANREIKQGDLYWLQVAPPGAAEPGYPHPYVVLQDDLLNHSRLATVVVCGLTSNLKRATEPGNVLLEVGEANLTRPSVIVVSQLATVDKTQVGEYIGTLSTPRIEQIWAGLRFQQRAFFARDRTRCE